jgi:hypothetical protein
MATGEATTITANPLTEHDLEHRSVRLQLFVLRQLVLKLYADVHGEAARGIVKTNLALIQEASTDVTRHPAEQAMLLEETAEVLADFQEHVDLIHAGAL